MAKPIFVITIAAHGSPGNYHNIAEMLEKKLPDYHVLISFDYKLENSKYQLFSDKEIEPIQIEELKKLISETYTSNAPIE